jgi:hypothetical protein
MYRNQIEALTETATDFLAKAKLSQKANESRTFLDAGMAAFAAAREIADSIRANSILCFLECATQLQRRGDSYPAYLEFCARNGLETLSEKDFQAVCAQIYPESPTGTPRSATPGRS